MRPSVLACMLAALLLVAAGPSRAQSPYNYAWCGTYPGWQGARSCYFNSYEQCIARLRAVRGYCTRNPAYTGPPSGAGQLGRARRDKKHR